MHHFMRVFRVVTGATLAVIIAAGAANASGARLNTSGAAATRLESSAEQPSATPVGGTSDTLVLNWALINGGLNDLRGVYSALTALPQYDAAHCAVGGTCVSFEVLPATAQLAATDRAVGVALNNPVPDTAIQAPYTAGLRELLACDQALRVSDFDSYETDLGTAVSDLQEFVRLLNQAGVVTD